MAWPCMDSFFRNWTIVRAASASRPEVGSSRNSRRDGLVTSSTPMDSSFFWVGVNVATSLFSGSFSRSEMVLMYSLSPSPLRTQEISRDSWTVSLSRWRSCCWTKPILLLKELMSVSGLPSIRMSPSTYPLSVLLDKTFSKVVLPAPDSPIRAVSPELM